MHIVSIEFTARRYHATPWDAHANEGRVEWPPCPWRLLRAWIAVGYNKLDWSDKPPEVAASLINKLAACNPEYSLPHATEAHTRHYMPNGKFARRNNKPTVIEDKDKVFDSFIRLTNAAERLLIRYDVDLEQGEQDVLSQLVSGLSYLGRAESWVDATLLDEGDEHISGVTKWCGLAVGEQKRRVRLLAPVANDEYEAWRASEAEAAADAAEARARVAADKADNKFTPAAQNKTRAKAEAPFPASLIDSLQQDNSKWQSEGWPRPPGSRWTDYELPDDVFSRKPLTTLSQSPTFQRPEAILLSIDGEGERGTLRPRMRRALPLMELLHSESIRHAAKLLGHVPAELTGKTAGGTPARGDHTHVHWLPLAMTKPDTIDHVLVYAPGGFSKDALQAVSAIRWAYAKGIRALSINMVGRGSIADMHEQLTRTTLNNPAALAVIGTSTTWESTTPMVLRKYLHRRGKKTPEGQIREELLERGIEGLESVDIWSSQEAVERKLKGFVLRRKPSKAQPPFERSWGVTLRFNEQVAGPITLGYGSHFGLGMFRASKAAE